MPELPDVEVFKEKVKNGLLNKKIEKIHVSQNQVIKTTSKKLRDLCEKNRLTSIDRQGKYLLLGFSNSDQLLAVHFGMTGSVEYNGASKKLPDYNCLSFDLANHHRLSITMPRKLGKIELVKDEDDFLKQHHLGPDFFETHRTEFIEKMQEKRGTIKSALTDQSLISGIGNVYSDEILFQAQIHPKLNVHEMNPLRLATLYKNARKVLKEAIKADANTENFPASFLIPHRHAKSRCPKCDTEIKKITVNSRSSYFCPKCQPE